MRWQSSYIVIYTCIKHCRRFKCFSAIIQWINGRLPQLSFHSLQVLYAWLHNAKRPTQRICHGIFRADKSGCTEVTVCLLKNQHHARQHSSESILSRLAITILCQRERLSEIDDGSTATRKINRILLNYVFLCYDLVTRKYQENLSAT